MRGREQWINDSREGREVQTTYYRLKGKEGQRGNWRHIRLSTTRGDSDGGRRLLSLLIRNAISRWVRSGEYQGNECVEVLLGGLYSLSGRA